MESFPSEKLTMTDGCHVEISYNKNGGVWYKALINALPPPKPRSRRREYSVRLFKDGDVSTPLTELTNRATFRPIPPKNIEAHVGIRQGSTVDAYHQDGWWTGLVVKEMLGHNKCFVFFDSPPDVVQFDRKQLRPHLDWVDENSWVIPGRDTQFLRKSAEEPLFSPGAMVEVRSMIDVSEVVWRPAIIVKEIEEDDVKKFIVKICENPFTSTSYRGRPNKTVDWASVRPRPPPVRVDEYQPGEYVEVFHGREWRQGRAKGGREGVPGFLYEEWRSVVLAADEKELHFKKTDFRPLKVWEDGVWKSREPPLAQISGDEMSDTVINAQEPVTPSPGVNVTAMKQTEAETQIKTSPTRITVSNQNGSGGDTTPENATSEEDNNRKRKREEDISSVAMVLPFEKKLPIWKTFETMEVFKKLPQSPHFSPLVANSEDSREVNAAGLMFIFSGLVEQLKDLKLHDPLSSIISLSVSLSELEKHGFDTKLPQQWINKFLSLRDEKAKKIEELKDAQRVTAEKERLKVENEHKIIKLQMMNMDADIKIAESKVCAAKIVQELEDVELRFQI